MIPSDIKIKPVDRLITYNPLGLSLFLNRLTKLTSKTHQKQAPNTIKRMQAIFCQKVVFSVITENLAIKAMKRKITNGLVIVKPKEVKKSCI